MRQAGCLTQHNVHNRFRDFALSLAALDDHWHLAQTHGFVNTMQIACGRNR